MKIVNDLIVEATKAELKEYYINKDLNLLISFEEFQEIMIEAGTIIKEEPHCVINGFYYSKEQFDRFSNEFGYSGF